MHIREPLYSNSAVIAWWLQSTSAQTNVIFWSIFTSENIHRKLLSLIKPAVYLHNKFFVGWMIVATVSELCQNVLFFPEEEDERNVCLCSGIHAYFR